MSNTLPIALTRLLKYISDINSVRKKLTHMTTMLRVGSPQCNHKDQGSSPTTTINENQTLGDPLQNVAQGAGQDLSGRPSVLK